MNEIDDALHNKQDWRGHRYRSDAIEFLAKEVGFSSSTAYKIRRFFILARSYPRLVGVSAGSSEWLDTIGALEERLASAPEEIKEKLRSTEPLVQKFSMKKEPVKKGEPIARKIAFKIEVEPTASEEEAKTLALLARDARDVEAQFEDEHRALTDSQTEELDDLEQD
eukprot:TRINITY_DN3232_c0_g1_i1.p1 TRINITY_DN3232_c0_g1~~TRINITY_DN3232_c0_g1_i1.p1  ORF type:complete len:167 (-),score=50.91 TRINITY_DN3232_c0_g1_i1:148-648(-)